MKGKYGTIQILPLRENCQNHMAKASPRKIAALFKGYKGGGYCTQSKMVNRIVTDFPDQEKMGSVGHNVSRLYEGRAANSWKESVQENQWGEALCCRQLKQPGM